MIEPKDVLNIDDADWEAFKKRAMEDEMYFRGKGDMLDTPEGRAKFCRMNPTSMFQKQDPEFPRYKITVFNVQGQGMVVKKLSRADPRVMEDVEYNAEGVEISRSYEPA